MQWGLHTSPLPSTQDVELSLDEIVAVLCHLHGVAHDPRFAAIHAHRRTEKIRRLDWRVGLTPSISVVEHGPVYWRSLSSSTRLPAVLPTGQNPSCPVRGFAPDRTTSVHRNATTIETFGPALEQMLVDAGYTGGIRECVRAALSVVGTRQIEAAVRSPAREIGTVPHETTAEAAEVASTDVPALGSTPTS